MLTTFQADEHVVAALLFAGPSGFLVKDTPPADIINAVRLVAAGDAIVSPSVTRTLLAGFGNTDASARHRLADPATRRSHRAGAGDSDRGRCGCLQRRDRRLPLHERGDGQGVRVTAAQQLDLSNRVQIAILVHNTAQA